MTAYIFDFDGTLADSFDFMLSWLATELRGPAAAAELHHADYRGLDMCELSLKLGARPWHWPGLFSAGKHRMTQNIDRIGLFDGLAETIQQLYTAGDKLFVVSANSSRNVELFLKRYGLADYFTATQGGAVLSKALTIRRLVRRYRLEPKQTWYISDEAKDMTAAHHAGVKAMAVTWGYNNLEKLAAKHPDRLIFDPAELVGEKN